AFASSSKPSTSHSWRARTEFGVCHWRVGRIRSAAGGRVTQRARMTTRAALAGLLVLMSTGSARAQDDLDTRVHRAWEAAYNLDRPEALAIARETVAAYPSESRAHRTLAAILWLQALFLRGAVTVDHYIGGITTSSLDLPDPPESIAREFHASIGRAIELAEAAVDARPDDPDALYD